MSKKDWQLLQAFLASGLTPERAKELGAADAEGRVAVLPCKKGARLFYVVDLHDALEPDGPVYIDDSQTAEEFLISGGDVLVGTCDGCFDKIGEGVAFLDRAEAEKEAARLRTKRREAQP